MGLDARFCPSCGVATRSSTVGSTPTPPQASAFPASGVLAPPAPPASPSWGNAAPPPYGYAQPTKTNGMAIASMVLGILWIYGIGAVLALIFGYMAKNQIDRSGGTQTGRGMAVAGIVLGWIGVACVVIVIIAAASSTSSGSVSP